MRRLLLLLVLLTMIGQVLHAQASPTIPRFDLPVAGPVLQRTTNAGSFFEAVGRKAAIFGYENKPFEAWVYPLKIYEDAQLHFTIDDYPVPVAATDIMRRIEVRPEATTLVYTHPAFTVRHVIFVPINEMGIIQLLDVSTTRPINIDMSFRPDLSLMWPAGLMTGFVGFDHDNGRYFTGEETQTYYGLVGSPAAVDRSVQPYQEEPKDVPARFRVRLTPEQAEQGFVPIITAASVSGREAAEATYDKLLQEAQALYTQTIEHYRQLDQTVQVITPDARLNEAYQWAKIGMDKGVATNPALGTGLIAGYRTSGNSERPGFAWFFGRDALWTALATSSVGDLETTRQALLFLAKYQRNDGKIPHEISQSAHLVDWFDDYLYPWASADASPLFVIVLADYYRQTGDLELLRKLYPSAEKAYLFHAATDTDQNHLIENTGVGHGWVEGGALYPPHEELYLQGLFIEASRDMAALSSAYHGSADKGKCWLQQAAQTLSAVEQKLWVKDGYYAFGTAYPKAPNLSEARPVSEADNKENTKVLSRGQEFAGTPEVVSENTSLQGVPLWWGLLDSVRAQQAITSFGRGAVATAWGARLLDKNSERYDPMSYHNGSVWPLFTGWSSMGAYTYGRPHVGTQALYASALLTQQDALGYVTELLSGDYNTAFGRSSHHQIWSEAMVASPLLRGLLGVSYADAGTTLQLSPKLPADWNSVQIKRLVIGEKLADVHIQRNGKEYKIKIAGAEGKQLQINPAFPLDAKLA